MFERFTGRARQVVTLAQDEARALKDNYIGTEHILLGLLREEEGFAAQALASVDVAAEDVRARVARIVGEGDEVTTGQIREDRRRARAFSKPISGNPVPPPRPDRASIRVRSVSQWWKLAERDLGWFFAIMVAGSGLGILIGWAICGH